MVRRIEILEHDSNHRGLLNIVYYILYIDGTELLYMYICVAALKNKYKLPTKESTYCVQRLNG